MDNLYQKLLYLNNYFVYHKDPDIIEQADLSYKSERYSEVYKLLSNSQSNIEALWRICRTLFKLAQDETLSETVQREITDKAYYFISTALCRSDENANAHKWMAILLDAKCGYEGTYSKIKSLNLVKKHMMRSVELNPNDVTVLYMLGCWCFQMSSLTRFQRQICNILYKIAPESSYEEANHYFLMAENLKSGFYIANTYMLGRTCLYMNQYYRARYYLKIAAQLPARGSVDEKYCQKAKKLADKLEQYDISEQALFCNFKK